MSHRNVSALFGIPTASLKSQCARAATAAMIAFVARVHTLTCTVFFMWRAVAPEKDAHIHAMRGWVMQVVRQALESGAEPTIREACKCIERGVSSAFLAPSGPMRQLPAFTTRLSMPSMCLVSPGTLANSVWIGSISGR